MKKPFIPLGAYQKSIVHTTDFIKKQPTKQAIAGDRKSGTHIDMLY
jgi:hypothetical protein